MRKYRIKTIGFKNIRNFNDIELDLSKNKTTFIMMSNGTGKTTTIELLRKAFSSRRFDPSEVISFRNGMKQNGLFKVQYKYQKDDDSEWISKWIMIKFNYKDGSYEYLYSAPSKEKGGMSSNRPNELEDFNFEFVEKFIFDGELADNFFESNYAEDAIKTVYSFNKFTVAKEILSNNFKKVLNDSSENAKHKMFLTRNYNDLKELEKQKKSLISRKKELEEKIEKDILAKKEKEKEYNSLLRVNKNDNNQLKLFDEKIIYLENKINDKCNSLKNEILKVGEINTEIERINYDLMENMQKLKLPKSVSEQFFLDIIKEKKCICGRDQTDKTRLFIKENYDDFLTENNIEVINEIKSSILKNSCSHISNEIVKSIESYREKLSEIIGMKARLKDKMERNGGGRMENLLKDLDEIKGSIRDSKNELEIILGERLSHTETTNLVKIDSEIANLKEKIKNIKKNHKMLKNYEFLNQKLKLIEDETLTILKKRIIDNTNKKIKKILGNNDIIIKDIEGRIKLVGKEKGSAGQNLIVVYSYLSSLFESSNIELPFIVDSPAGSIDIEKRTNIASIIPNIFKQLGFFVMSSEREGFCNYFMSNDSDVHYLTVKEEISYLDKNNEEVKYIVSEGLEDFNSLHSEVS